jgi:ribonuclease G
MSKELIIASNRHETKVALTEEDQLVEVYFQRAKEYSLAGSIHKGRVTRVLPGMQSAFVDLGLERDTFLYVSDFLEEHEDFDRVSDEDRGSRPERGERDRGERDRGDRDRGDRSRRRDQPPPPQQAGPEAAAAAIVEGVDPATAVDSSAAPPAPAAAAQQPRQDDRGERRGRRSRRRRNRGRGFPDSKYASETAAAPAPVEAEEPEEPEAAQEAEMPPIILPGESLRKYRGAPTSSAPAEHHTEAAAEPGVERTTETETEFDEPIHYPPENAVPDAPLHPHIEPPSAEPTAAPTGEPESAKESEAAETEESAVRAEAPMPPPLPADYLKSFEDEPSEPDLSEPQPLSEEEDREIQEMILSRADSESELEEEIDLIAPAEDGEEEESAEAASTGETSGEESGAAATGEESAAEPVAGSAAVRERGGRFQHRVSRRMRGRRRDGQRPPEGRGPESGEARERDGRRPDQDRDRNRDRNISRPTQQLPSIAELLKEGQEIIVQIAKEPLGQKGARITSHIALPGRYVVYMPTLEHMGVSRKIGSDEERQRLKRVLQGQRPGPVGGFITRTAAEGRTEEEIGADMQFLYSLWQDIKAKAERKPAPLLLHHDLDIVQRILRDQLADNFKAIWIDSEEVYESVLRFIERFQPALVGKVKLYTREAPIFDAFGITAELEKALRPKVWLKSGGYIVINQTEALVAIDVNTGKFVGKSNRLEDTIVKTNTEAIKEIVRQVRLRDLGGIIVIDFIDMDERKNRQKVMQALEEAMRADRAPYKILQFNDFGLVAITRKRVKQSLERTLCAPCPHCDGAGYVKSVQTVVSEILTEARKMASSVEGKEVLLRVHPDVGKVLKSHQNKYLEELEEVLRRPVLIKSDPLLHHEKFDLA